MHVHLPNEAACMELAMGLSKYIQAGDILALNGQLGSGKTTFVRSLVHALKGDVTAVHSPTYTLLHSYHASIPVIHVDAYRLQGEGDLESLGFSELSEGAIACVEWAERLEQIGEDENRWVFEFKHDVDNTRSADIQAPLNRHVILEPQT